MIPAHGEQRSPSNSVLITLTFSSDAANAEVNQCLGITKESFPYVSQDPLPFSITILSSELHARISSERTDVQENGKARECGTDGDS